MVENYRSGNTDISSGFVRARVEERYPRSGSPILLALGISFLCAVAFASLGATQDRKPVCGTPLECYEAALIRVQQLEAQVRLVTEDMKAIRAELTQKAASQQLAAVAQTVDHHEKLNAPIRGRVEFIIKNANTFADGPRAANLRHAGNQAFCPPGHYMVGVKLGWSGTCNRQCDGDGGILAGLQVICRPMQ